MGSVLYRQPITISERYGTGVVWSSDGNLYVLGEGESRQVAVANGSFLSSSVSESALPADISALL
ncbi:MULTISPECIES: hypothetical protein [Nocardiaceae]|uniref:Uncharacterized protein n=1 Tax=Rhodococcoides corynebacterioides TaxID=53972 RepID=A0ABS2KVW9_9NOCA|nr:MULTISPECIES: hypothetical protein [Rhodococcus]MBM7415956.1 hypothetical protein [Rhodococcus corynebacterioides]MBP1114209.1 hypothetical protein [Rhodococcus sp. PvP016]